MYLTEGGSEVAVLVLAGSSGRVEQARCDLLATAGATALSFRWFEEAVDQVPLETFDGPLALLRDRCRRLVVLGTSRGAEAALLLGALHSEVDAVVAVSASDVVWAALTSERPQRSSWTLGGRPLPFVPYDDAWSPEPRHPPRYVGLYRQSLRTFADRVPAARLPVERISGEVLLAAGGADALWPSLDFAHHVVRRRAAAGLATTLVSDPGAGHRVVLPGEVAPAPPAQLAHGGSAEADARLGRLLWPALLEVLFPAGRGSRTVTR